MCNPEPDALPVEATPETFANLRARYRGYVDPPAKEPDLDYVETWLLEMVRDSATNEC